MAWDSEQVNDAVTKIQRHLASQPDGQRLALRVPSGGFRVDEDWLIVIVEPGIGGVRAYDYVQALGRVEQDLHQEGLANITLVPAMPD